jgi:hypothetical protein
MALRLFRQESDKRERAGKVMETSKKADDPALRPPKAPERGAPATYAAHAMRKDVTVRVSVAVPTPEPEELREHGYGHGV